MTGGILGVFLKFNYKLIGQPNRKTFSLGDLVGFYSISTIIGNLKPNPFYTYISNINDLV